MASRRGIKLTLEQLRIATKKKRRGFPDCHNETMKVIQSLHKDDYSIKSIFPLVQAAQRCFEESYAKKKAGSTQKASTLYHLSKYVKRNR